MRGTIDFYRGMVSIPRACEVFPFMNNVGLASNTSFIACKQRRINSFGGEGTVRFLRFYSICHVDGWVSPEGAFVAGLCKVSCRLWPRMALGGSGAAAVSR